MPRPSITGPLDVPVDLGGRSLLRLVTEPLKRIAFWAAIALPFLHVPLLATGLDTRTTTVAFTVLLVLNVASLIVGHYYDSG